MTKQHSILATLAFALLATAGCDALETVDPLECTLVAGPEEVSLDSTVDYEVDLEGDGEVESITYRYGSQSQTVTDPALPWSASREVSDGEEVYLSARGSVTDGLIEINIRAIGSENGGQFSITLSDECEQTSN